MAHRVVFLFSLAAGSYFLASLIDLFAGRKIVLSPAWATPSLSHVSLSVGSS
jgi:hypothetical protein